MSTFMSISPMVKFFEPKMQFKKRSPVMHDEKDYSLSNNFKVPWDIIHCEHNYARRDCLGNFSKPTKHLFASSLPSHSSEVIDVTTISQNPSVDYDAVKSLQLMEECERFAIFARVPRPEESLNDWEEAIPKEGWSLDKLNLFQRVAEILHADRLARLALSGSWSEPARRRAHVDRTAQRFREAMTAFHWDAELAQWLHCLLIDHLDMGYLAAYVDILQTLKVRIPSLVERLLAGAVYGKAPVVQQGMDLLLKRPWDPAVSTINAQKMGKLPSNPVILLVPSNLHKQPQPTPRCNLWASHLSNLATLIVVTPTAGTITARMTPPAYLEQMISVTKNRLAAIRAEHPGRPIVVVGWRSGAAVALQAVATEPVAAVISLGLATRTVEGPRGDPDDSIYDITCPVLFITGEYASTSRPEELEEIRSKMLAPTGLVVVGSSDDCLRMRRRQKITHGVTQSLVDRAVLEAMGEFLADVLLQPILSLPARSDKNQAPAISRKRRLSTGSSVDSEGSHNNSFPDTPSKQLRQALTSPLKLNGSPVTPIRGQGRRGRKPGSLNRVPRLPKQVKTIQTLTPTKKNYPDLKLIDIVQSNDVTLDVGSMSSLAPVGPILRTGTPQGTIGPGSSTAMQTFRIHAGKVSTSSAPPGDVMPIRLPNQATSLCKNTYSIGTSHLLVVGPTLAAINGAARARLDDGQESSVPIKTLNPVSRTPTARPLTFPLRPNITPSPLGRPSHGALGSTRKLVTAQKNVILMPDKRNSQFVTSPGQFKLATVKTSPAKIIKTSPISIPKSPVGRLTVSKRFVPATSSALQQKQIVVKSRVSKSADSEDSQDSVPLVIVKSRKLEDSDDKTKVFLQRIGGDKEVPMMILKNRSLAFEKDPESSELKRHVILKDRSSKQLVLTRNEDFIVQEPVSKPKVVMSWDTDACDDDSFIYEVKD